VLFLAGSLFAQTARWEAGKVVSVEQVSTPAKTPDPDCKTLPKGESLPARCSSAYLRAVQFWRVTVDVGNRRLVLLPYKPLRFIDSLNPNGPTYVDPKLTAGSLIEVAVYPNKSVRLRTDKGEGIPATVDSEDVVSSGGAITKAETPPPPARLAATAAPVALSAAPVALSPATAKVVLLENGDFTDLESAEIKSQDIGDGAALYSFVGDSSTARIASNKPVFLVMGGNDVELARLQVGKANRQLLYSLTKKHSASPLPITVTQVSDTLRRVTMNEPLAPGQYVFVMQNSNRAFLFEAR